MAPEYHDLASTLTTILNTRMPAEASSMVSAVTVVVGKEQEGFHKYLKLLWYEMRGVGVERVPLI